MITPINIALLGVVLAAVALVILRRRHSGAIDQAVSDEAPHQTLATVDEPAAADEDEVLDVFSKHIWSGSEAAATLAPVREDEATMVADAELDADEEDQAEDEALEVDDEADDDAQDLDAGSLQQDQDTGEIPDLELEAKSGPDDGLGEIITEPGWYLPGETDMTRGGPAAQSGLLITEESLALTGAESDDELAPAAGDPLASLLEDSADDFDATGGWAAPAEEEPQAAETSWLGLAGEESAAAAIEDEIGFEAAPSPSDDLFALPPLAAGIADEEQDLGAPSLPLDRWQEDPVTPSPTFALGGAPAEATVTQHGPLTVSIDPAALLAIETEAIERSTSRENGNVSWELTLKVELRQRSDAPESETD